MLFCFLSKKLMIVYCDVIRGNLSNLMADENESVHVKIKKLCLLSSALCFLTACSYGQAFSPRPMR